MHGPHGEGARRLGGRPFTLRGRCRMARESAPEPGGEGCWPSSRRAIRLLFIIAHGGNTRALPKQLPI